MRRNQIVLGFVISIASVLGVWAAQGNLPHEADWQYSEGVSVQLGVRDKNGDSAKYKALFTVRAKSGRKYTCEKDVEGNQLGYVYFPEDFKVYGEPGEYTWKCFVNGNVVADGRFRLTTVKTYSDRATVIRE